MDKFCLVKSGDNGWIVETKYVFKRGEDGITLFPITLDEDENEMCYVRKDEIHMNNVQVIGSNDNVNALRVRDGNDELRIRTIKISSYSPHIPAAKSTKAHGGKQSSQESKKKTSLATSQITATRKSSQYYRKMLPSGVPMRIENNLPPPENLTPPPYNMESVDDEDFDNNENLLNDRTYHEYSAQNDGEPRNNDGGDYEEDDIVETAPDARSEELRQVHERRNISNSAEKDNANESRTSPPIPPNSQQAEEHGDALRDFSTSGRSRSSMLRRSVPRRARRNLRTVRGTGKLQRLENDVQSLKRKLNKFVATANHRGGINTRRYPQLTESIVLEDEKEFTVISGIKIESDVLAQIILKGTMRGRADTIMHMMWKPEIMRRMYLRPPLGDENAILATPADRYKIRDICMYLQRKKEIPYVEGGKDDIINLRSWMSELFRQSRNQLNVGRRQNRRATM